MSNVYTHNQRRPLRMGVIPIQSEKAAVQSASLGLKCITSNTDNDMQAKDRYHRWEGIGVLPAFFPRYLLQRASVSRTGTAYRKPGKSVREICTLYGNIRERYPSGVDKVW